MIERSGFPDIRIAGELPKIPAITGKNNLFFIPSGPSHSGAPPVPETFDGSGTHVAFRSGKELFRKRVSENGLQEERQE